MATADELLRSNGTQPNPEGHIVVGGDRFMTVPSNLKRLGVQYDHNMETVVFDCPRYWDNRDMSQMAVYINYALSNGYMDRYPADNISADGDIMHFEWTISRNATQVAGAVSFLICVMKTDAEGNEERHWNSELCEECYISAGMETEESPVDTYPDLVTQLLLRMDSVEQINIQASEMEAILAETQEVAAVAEQTKNEAIDASNYIKNNYANAIKDVASGTIIRVDDINPIQHTVKAQVCGRNHFNVSDYTTEKDYSNDKTIYAISARHLIIGKTYTVFSEIPMQWFKISNSATGYSCVGIGNSTTGFTSYTFTHQRNANISESEDLKIYINNLDLTAMYDLDLLSAMNICIVEGTVGVEYEPFIDPTTISVCTNGKNMFAMGTISDYQYVGATSISGNAIVGTVTSSNSSHVINLTNKYPPGTYNIQFDYSDTQPRVLIRTYDGDGSILTTCTNLTSNGFTYNDAYQAFFKNGKTHTVIIPEGVAYWCVGFVYPVTDTAPIGKQVSVYRIHVEYTDENCVYKTYEGARYTPNADGTVDLASIDPTMTIYTDIPGAILNVQYLVDTETRFNEVVTDTKIQAAVDAWLTAHYSSAEGVSF